LTVIGIHTPETDAEGVIQQVRKKVKANDMRYSIAVDGQAETWKAWDNQYWPSIYT
jgi:hypothetical protein